MTHFLENCVCICSLPCLLNNICWTAQILKVLITQFPSASCHFLLHKHFLQHPQLWCIYSALHHYYAHYYTVSFPSSLWKTKYWTVLHINCSMAFCRKWNRNNAAYLKNAVNILVTYIYKMSFRGVFVCVHICKCKSFKFNWNVGLSVPKCNISHSRRPWSQCLSPVRQPNNHGKNT